MKGVIPLGMSGVGLEREVSHDGVGDGDSSRVGVEIQSGGYCQASRGARCADQADNRVEVDEWPPPPMDADVSEQSVFDLVPLG